MPQITKNATSSATLSLRGILEAGAFFGLVTTGAATLVTLLLVLGLYSDLASHFRPQLITAQFIILLLVLLLRHKIWLLALLVLMLPNAWGLLPYYLPRSVPAETAEAHRFSILHLNVLTKNTHHDQVLALLEKHQPDLVVLQEINDTWEAALRPSLKTYPHHVSITRTDNFGIGLYSRIPLLDGDIVYYGKPGEVYLPSIKATVTPRTGEPFTLIATHPLPPSSQQGFRLRNIQLQDVIAHEADFLPRRIVVGDLNSGPWSDIFHRLTRGLSVRDSQLGFGVQPSWCAGTILATDIDHVLPSPHFAVLNRQLLNDIGSDHRPVYVELGLSGS